MAKRRTCSESGCSNTATSISRSQKQVLKKYKSKPPEVIWIDKKDVPYCGLHARPGIITLLDGTPVQMALLPIIEGDS